MVQFKRKLLHEDAYPRYLINDEIGDKIKGKHLFFLNQKRNSYTIKTEKLIFSFLFLIPHRY